MNASINAGIGRNACTAAYARCSTPHLPPQILRSSRYHFERDESAGRLAHPASYETNLYVMLTTSPLLGRGANRSHPSSDNSACRHFLIGAEDLLESLTSIFDRFPFQDDTLIHLSNDTTAYYDTSPALVRRFLGVSVLAPKYITSEEDFETSISLLRIFYNSKISEYTRGVTR